MKRIICIAVSLIIGINCLEAQELGYRKISGESLSLASKFEKLKPSLPQTNSDAYRTDLYVSIRYDDWHSEKYDYTGYSIVFRCYVYDGNFYFPSNGKCLIKTTTGKIIALTTTGGRDNHLQFEFNPEDGSIYDSGSDYGIYYLGSFGDTSEYCYQITCYSNLSEDDIMSLITEGIVKIRLETTGAYIECDYKDYESKKVDHEKVQINIPGYTIKGMYQAVKACIDPYTTM